MILSRAFLYSAARFFLASFVRPARSGTVFLGAILAAHGEPAITLHTQHGEVERPREKRPRAGEADEPGYERYQSFTYTWPEVTDLPDARVAAKLNRKLRALVPPNLPPKSSIIHGFDQPVDESVIATHAQLTPQTLTVVIERGHRGADAPKHSLNSGVHHFDLATGRTLKLADLVPRKHWRAAEKLIQRYLRELNEEAIVYVDREFSGLRRDTEAYLAEGDFNLLIRADRGSSAVEDQPFFQLPAGLFAPWLSPRGREYLEAPINDGWRLEKAANDFFAVCPQRPGWRVPLHCEGWVVYLNRWEICSQNPAWGLLYYFAGIAGTSTKYAATRVAIIRLADGKVLGHPVLRFDPIGDAESLPQPSWIWHNNRLTVRTEGKPDEVY